MCDTIVVVGDAGVLFAKNSDRDANEAQAPEWYPAAEHAPGSTVACTYIEIPQVERTNAVLLSRPFWMWGAEIGANEHGVTIGNEAVFTTQPYAKTGLTGMDLLRLALERAVTAEGAVDTIVSLLEAHGQGGGCGYEDRSFTYHNSFLVADRSTAYVLETAGAMWSVEHVEHGVRTISNGLTIPGFAEAHRDRLRSAVSACDVRTALTTSAASDALGVGDLMAVLRSHGPSDWPRYRAINGTLRMPCMHGGGLVASSSSTAGWVSDLAADVHWLTATSAQCLSIFKPTSVVQPVDIGGQPGERFDGSLWWRHERLARQIMQHPERLAGIVTLERDELEAEWLGSVPSSQEAFDLHGRKVDEWQEMLDAAGEVADQRPWYARRYWQRRPLPA